MKDGGRKTEKEGKETIETYDYMSLKDKDRTKEGDSIRKEGMKEEHGAKESIGKCRLGGQGKEVREGWIGWRQGNKKGRKRRREVRKALEKGTKADGTTKRQVRVESVKGRG